MTSRVAAWSLLLFAAACNDATAPATEAGVLSFCAPTTWVGLKNEGQDWRTIAQGPTTANVRMTDRVVIARHSAGATIGSASTLEFFYLTRDQALASFSCSTGGKELSGTVAGIGTGPASVALGRQSLGVYASGATGSYALTNVPDGPLDLVATHDTISVIRRAQTFAANAQIPVIDFASNETFTLLGNTLNIDTDGLPALVWSTELLTPSGTIAPLVNNLQPCCTGQRVYSVPTDRLIQGDMQHLTVRVGVDGDLRLVERFYTAGADQSIVVGPPAHHPAFSSASANGQLWRVDLASHAEYDRQIVIIAYEPSPVNVVTVIRATNEYFGAAPATWSFTIPDLSRVSGFSAEQVEIPNRWECTESSRPWRSPFTAVLGATSLTGHAHN